MLALHTHSRHRKRKTHVELKNFQLLVVRCWCCVSEGVLTVFFLLFSRNGAIVLTAAAFLYLISFHNTIVYYRKKKLRREKFSDFLISWTLNAEQNGFDDVYLWLIYLNIFEMVEALKHARAVGGRDWILRMSRKGGNVENDEGEWEWEKREVEWWYEKQK